MKYSPHEYQSYATDFIINHPAALIQKLSSACDAAYDCVERLKDALSRIPGDEEAAADHCHSVIVPLMAELRTQADILEQNTAKRYWPYPTYSDLLFY